MLGIFLKVMKALNSNVSPWSISFATGLALVIGLTPLWSAHNILILLFAFIFRIHLASFFVSWGVFTAFAYLLDPWFHQIGLYWLEKDNLQSLWTSLYQSDFWQVLHFNHTITLGSLIVSLIGFLPLVILVRVFVRKYRATLMPWFNKLKVIQVLKGSRLYELYERIEG